MHSGRCTSAQASTTGSGETATQCNLGDLQAENSRRDDDTSHAGRHRAPVWNQEFQFLVRRQNCLLTVSTCLSASSCFACAAELR